MGSRNPTRRICHQAQGPHDKNRDWNARSLGTTERMDAPGWPRQAPRQGACSFRPSSNITEHAPKLAFPNSTPDCHDFKRRQSDHGRGFKPHRPRHDHQARTPSASRWLVPRVLGSLGSRPSSRFLQMLMKTKHCPIGPHRKPNPPRRPRTTVTSRCPNCGKTHRRAITLGEMLAMFAKYAKS